MKITKVSASLVNAKLRNWVFVRVETSEPGLFGIGEATLEWQSLSVAQRVEEFSSLLVGKDPRDIARLWEGMYRYPFFRGGAVTMSALSGIDQALHDIQAKSLGVPLWRLLGGLARDRVQMYDHVGGGDSNAVYGELSTGIGERVAASKADGFNAIKILAVPKTRSLDGNASLNEAEAIMSAARQAGGDEMDIMVDFHGRTTSAMAIQYAKVLEPFRPMFIEEVVGPEIPAAEMARVAQATTIPVAAGERLFHRSEFLPLLEKGAIAVAQPDVCHAGGITETMRIGALAGTFGVTLAPHNPLGPIATMVNIHIGFALPNFLIQEVMRSDVPWREEIVMGTMPIIDGYVSPPMGPGIGIEIDESAAARHPYEEPEPIQWTHADGGVAEW
jgi:galactonate dehydratase